MRSSEPPQNRRPLVKSEHCCKCLPNKISIKKPRGGWRSYNHLSLNKLQKAQKTRHTPLPKIDRVCDFATLTFGNTISYIKRGPDPFPDNEGIETMC